jgi:hypothetical protein
MAEMLLRASSEKVSFTAGKACVSVSGEHAPCSAAMSRPIVRKLAPRSRAPVPFALLAMVAFAVSLSGCQVVEGIFKAGFWVGVIAVVGVLALLVFAVGKLVR